MNSKQKYQSFCIAESLPVFVQPWYLDAVCAADNWNLVLVERDHKVLAVLPYYLNPKGPFKIIGMPWLTKMMGPYLGKAFQNGSKSRRLLKELIEQLPKVAAFHQNFHYQQQDWLPFYWKGFQQSTAYSYVFDDLTDLEAIYGNMSADYRNNKIKKAKQLVKLRTDLSICDFYKVQQMTFTRQGKDFVIPFSFMENFDQAVSKNQSGKKFFAVDESGQIHSVVYLTWDKNSAYYLLAGDNPDLRASGAGIFLVWEVVQYTKKVLGLNRFDFQGSMIPGIEKVRRSFGAKQVPYFQIWKEYSSIYRYLKFLKGS